MTLIRTGILNGIAVAVRMACALAVNKILAVLVGPSGFGLIGQFQNLAGIAGSLAGGVLATGVTKTTAEHFDCSERQHAIWQTAIRLTLMAAVIVGLALGVFREPLAAWLLRDATLGGVVLALAAVLPALTVNAILLAILNGKKEVEPFVAASIAGSLISLAVMAALAANFGLVGALVAVAINPALALFASALLVRGRPWFRLATLWGPLTPAVAKELSGFGLMAVTAALAAPLTQIAVRDLLVAQLGLPAAGYWQAGWKISETYLLLVTSTLSVYYLPRLAEIRNAAEMRREVLRVYRLVLPVTALGAALIYLARDPIIGFLFSSEFAPMRELFGWQLAGDVIKIGSWILGYVMVGRALVKPFVITEVGFSLSFVMLVWLLVPPFGLVGAAIAYAINYAAYWICMVFIGWRAIREMPDA